MYRHFFSAALVIATTAILTGPATAGEKDIVLCLPGFPGTQAQAQPYLDKMLRHLETKLAWPQNSMTGIYLPDGESASGSLKDRQPGIALVGASVYVEHHKALGMNIIAKVEVDGRKEETFAVVTRKDGPDTIQGLAGKTVEGAVVHNAQYVYNVILDRAVAPGSLILHSQKRPLKALRNVSRGTVDAAIIDESVQKNMAELPFAENLKVVYVSKPIPAPVVVVMGAGAASAAKLKSVLVGMCGSPDGQELCKTLTLSSIQAATDAEYKKLLKLYSR